MADAMSSQSSGVTGGDLSGSLEQEEISNMHLSGKKPTSSEWTDEKHSMYLKSMEASFVDQLYKSMDSSGWHSHKRHSSMRSSKHAESRASEQFKVHQNCSWQSIRFDVGKPPPRQAKESHFLHGSPWIQQYRTVFRQDQTIQGNAFGGRKTVSSGERMMLMCGLTNILKHPSVCQPHQDSSFGEEFSDQNFDEDDNGKGTGSLHTMKRTKIVESTSPGKDQEVPFGRFSCSEFLSSMLVKISTRKMPGEGERREKKKKKKKSAREGDTLEVGARHRG